MKKKAIPVIIMLPLFCRSCQSLEWKMTTGVNDYVNEIWLQCWFKNLMNFCLKERSTVMFCNSTTTNSHIQVAFQKLNRFYHHSEDNIHVPYHGKFHFSRSKTKLNSGGNAFPIFLRKGYLTRWDRSSVCICKCTCTFNVHVLYSMLEPRLDTYCYMYI